MSLIEKTVCFALLARDCKEKLQRNIEEIFRGESSFKKIDIVIVENDSIDGTKEYLLGLSKRDNVHVITKNATEDYSFNSDKSGSSRRIEKMVKLRNEYITFYNEHFRSGTDFLIVIDADIDGFAISSVIKAIDNAPENWSALFANGRYYMKLFGKALFFRYYDLFAFIPEKQYWGKLEFTYSPTYRELALLSDLTTMRILRKYHYFPVVSAFGGVGIYNMVFYHGEKYTLLMNERSSFFDSICEHVPFNSSFHKEGGSYICTDLLVKYEKINSIKQVFTTFIPSRVRLFFNLIILKRIKE